MQSKKNLLVIDKSSEQITQIKKQIQAINSKVSIFTLSSREQLNSITQNNIKCIFLNANIGKSDTLYFLRFLATLKEITKTEIPIFITSEDFDLLMEIIEQFSFEKMELVHTPLDLNALVEKMSVILFGSKAIPVIQKENAPQKNLNMNVEFMNIFITSTQKIITEMAQVKDLSHSPPALLSKLKEPLSITISANIAITSAHFEGNYYIAFPTQTFLNFYEVVVMEKCTEINDGNKDFASELANIIYGQCKQKLSADGLHLEMVIPSVHMGEIQHPVVIIIPFICSLGKFYLAIAPKTK